MERFYRKYFNDKSKRYFLFGINPGRLGAGMTGVPFTDPVKLKADCNIDNELMPKTELSSNFIYEAIHALGGPEAFYRRFYISSLCPLGFLKDDKNYNYYDSKALTEAVRDKIIDAVNAQLQFPCYRDAAFSIGKGKNFQYFQKLNDEYRWFDKIIDLPHPRWVLQYKRKSKELYLEEYVNKLGKI